MKAPRFSCHCKLSELATRAQQALDHDARCLLGLVVLLLLAAYLHWPPPALAAPANYPTDLPRGLSGPSIPYQD